MFTHQYLLVLKTDGSWAFGQAVHILGKMPMNALYVKSRVDCFTGIFTFHLRNNPQEGSRIITLHFKEETEAQNG